MVMFGKMALKFVKCEYSPIASMAKTLDAEVSADLQLACNSNRISRFLTESEYWQSIKDEGKGVHGAHFSVNL